ncbi:hypothetical protein A6A08_00620 [Nocardiopsis sp. TSRI0078]|uniref:hypothetical protein n=1 Tax=unclassified Nocardiopsis TaxID=2649073 RepID=UPI00093E43EE|nr:hypothetical protein [Nocardiopsis sp. TSRI0078]OKI23347.1 hypothetical protein A6A08_00620 [Nocardiopsis sp. TSRI0078]
MTDNGGERRNSGAGDSWFKPSENRYRTQSEYQDPLEDEETGESQETVFPDSGGYTGLSSSRPAMVEPYPEALGGPPPSNGISYPGAGASAYQPLTRVPGEPEEPSFPSVAASARVPLPEEEREDSRSDEPQTQEIPALDSWDPSGGADAAPEGSDEHDDTDSGPSAWSMPGPAAGQPWDGGARTWEGGAPAAVPGDGAVDDRPWGDDAPDAWSSPAPGTPGPDAVGDRPWHSGDAGRYGEDTAETHTPDAGDPGVAWGAPSAPAPEGVGASGPEALGGQPWDDGPASWDTPSPGPGEADGAAPWSDTAGGRPWDGDELGSPAWDADAPAADTDRAGANTWGAVTGAPGDRPWEDDHRAQDAPGPGTADPDAAWDAPSFAPGPVDGPGAEAVDDRPWDAREQASSAWDGDGADEVGPPAWGGEAADTDAARAFAEQGAEAPAGGRPWDDDELGSSTWSADAPVGGADRPGADAWGTTAGTDGSPASGTPGAPGSEAFGGQPWDDGSGARPASDAGFPGVGAQGERSWDADDPLGADAPGGRPWGEDPLGADAPGERSWDADAPLGTDAPGGRPWGEDPLGGSEPRGRSWSPDAPLGADVPGERSWDDGPLGADVPGERSWGADDPLGAGAQGKRSWDEDPLGADASGGRSWDTDELGAGSWGADGSAAGTDGLDSWTPPRENGDGWAGSGANEPWTDGRGDELSPPDPGAGSGNTWVFGRDDPRMPDAVREAERRRRESAAGSGTPGGADPDTGELSAAVPASEDPLAAIADMQTRARSRDEEPGDATRMFDVREEDWEDGRDPAGYGRTWEDGEAGYDDGPDGYGYEDGPDGYDAGPAEHGYDAGPAEHGYDAAPDASGYGDGPGDPGYDGGTDDPEYDDGFTPADYGMPEAAVGRRRRRDPIAGDFPGFDDRPLGGDPGDPYPGYDNIDFLADTERGAVLTLWLGVASLLPGVGLATALVALLVTGPKAKKEIRESRGQLDGLGLITTGTVFAVLGILVTVISVAVWLVL